MHMLLRAVLVVLSLPGIAITLFAGASVANLLYDEMYPDPNNIGHGMAMAHAFIPMLFWAVLGVLYLIALWFLWCWLKRRRKRSDDIKLPRSL